MQRLITQFCLPCLLLGVAAELRAQEQSYSAWKYDAPNKRYRATYQYQASPEAKPQTQQVVYYPQANKNGWVYYYNPSKRTYWGRCASPKHPQYNKNRMQWSYLQKNNRWGELTIDCPSVPGTENGPEIEAPPPPPGN